MAAALLAKSAHDRDIPEAKAASAGFLDGGRRVHEHVVTLLEQDGVDVSRKRSQKVEQALIDKADLVLTMTTEHARGIVGRFPESLPSVYTMRHFSTVVPVRPHGTSISDWLDQINMSNRRAYLSDDELLDIPDPIGHDLDVFVELAEELRNSIAWIMSCAFPNETDMRL